MTMILSREQILAADDLPREEVEVPEWGGSVYVRTMTALERDELEAWYLSRNGKGTAGVRAELVARTVVGDDGQRLFSGEDIAALNSKNAAAMSRLYTVASRLNGLTREDVDELEKNS